LVVYCFSCCPLAQGKNPGKASISEAPSEAKISLFALDQAGHPVPKISQDSQRVYLDAKPIGIESLRALRDVPLIFSLVADVSGSSSLSAER
jgi:hypothetical protein